MRRFSGAAFHLAAATTLLLAAVTVPLPVTELGPGPTTELGGLIRVDGRATTPLRGRPLLTTVVAERTTPAGLLRGLVSPAVELQLGTRPARVDPGEFFEAERRRFERSFGLAAAVGARAAGVDVRVQPAAFVSLVLPDAPAAPHLEPGDVVTAVDGRTISGARQLQRRLDTLAPGREVTLTVRRDGTSRQVRLSSGTYRFRGRTETGFGIWIETVAADVRLPFDVSRGRTDVGGPSAGLMVALTVYDLLADEDLLDGRVVAGSGELFPDGRVGPVGGIEAKVAAAERAGAAVFLASRGQAGRARAAARRLRVVGVEDLAHAIEALG